ncbi:junctional sarcoplasmic reticulum protein 1-like [Polyodon spathula]|uniref:junctional sarcoplasmic reticulum protein 1-like n=1 Tax=Polyodon spathula TaxID=7913 RepID=UPI001B7EA195|nr:junctional sarcoplasmic reticulum protein 1-like [Polyodon spathula]
MDESTFETFEGDIGPEEGLEELPAPGESLPKTTKQLRNQDTPTAKTGRGQSSGVSREVEGFETVEQELVQTQETPLPTKPSPAKQKAKKAVPEKPARKAEPSVDGPVCDEERSPWNGITLNRCLVVATVIVLVSVGFQMLQEAVTSEDEVSDPESDVLSWSDSNAVEDKTEQPESSFFGSLMWWSWVPEVEDSEEAAARGRRSESRHARARGRRDHEQEGGGRGRAEKHRVRRRAGGIRELLKNKEEKKGDRKHAEKPPKQREQKQVEHKRREDGMSPKRREDSDDDKKSSSKGNRMSLLADKGVLKKGERGKYQLKGGKRND